MKKHIFLYISLLIISVSKAFAGWSNWAIENRPLLSPTTRICYLCPNYWVEVLNNQEDGSLGTPFARFSFDSGQTWGTWINLTGQMRGRPTVTSKAANSFDIFIRGGENMVWHKSFVGGVWSGWESMSGQIISSPFSYSIAPGFISVCARG